MAQTQKPKFTPERRGLGLIIAAAFALVILLLFLVAAMPRSLFLSAKAEEADFLSLNTEEAFRLEEGVAVQMYPFNSDHLVKVTNELVSYVSFKGSEEQAVQINCPTPLVTINGDYILVSDLGGYRFYLLDGQGLVLQGKTSAPIRSAAVSSSGKTAFIMEELHTKGVLRVLDEKGKHMLDWRVRDRLRSGYVINMAFSQDNTAIDVSLLNTDGASLQSILTRMDLTNATIASSIVQPDPTAYPLLFSAADSRVLMVSSESVVQNRGAGADAWLNFYRIQEVAVDAAGMALLASPQPGEVPSLYFFPFDDSGNANQGSASTGTQLGQGAFALEASYGHIAVASGDGVYILRQNNLSEPNYFACGSPVIRQKFLSESHLLIICRDSVQIIRV